MSELIHLKHWKGFEYSESSGSVSLTKIMYSEKSWDVEQKIRYIPFTRRSEETIIRMELAMYRVKCVGVPFYAVVSCVQSEDRSWRFSVLSFKEDDAERAQRDFKSLLKRTDEWFTSSENPKYVLRA